MTVSKQGDEMSLLRWKKGERGEAKDAAQVGGGLHDCISCWLKKSVGQHAGVRYLHHHLLPCWWLADGGVGWQIGPLKLQVDVAALLLQGSGQLLKTLLLLLHRGQDAGSRANVVVLHVQG